jgi:hypothetical protein
MIRQSVLDRAVTQGSRGAAGNEWHERFWSVCATCGIQKTPVINYFKECLSAYFGIGSYPNLINQAWYPWTVTLCLRGNEAQRNDLAIAEAEGPLGPEAHTDLLCEIKSEIFLEKCGCRRPWRRK